MAFKTPVLSKFTKVENNNWIILDCSYKNRQRPQTTSNHQQTITNHPETTTNDHKPSVNDH